MLTGWSNERKVVVGFGLALVAVAFFLFFPYLSHPGSDQVRHWAEQQKRMFAELQMVLADFQEAQLNERAYIRSGNEKNFDLFNDAIGRVHQRLFALRTLDESDARTADRLRLLENEVDDAIAKLRFVVKAKHAKTIESARLMRMSDDAMASAGAAAVEIRKLQGEQVAQMQDRVVQYSSLPNYQLLVGVLLITFLGLLGLSTFLMSKKWQLTITELKEREKQLEASILAAQAHMDKLANRDMLTELLNMKGLEQALVAEQNRAGRAGGQLVAMLVNIDNFKGINEGLGHGVGDTILRELGRRISNTLRPSDHVGRIGRDEFVVLLPETQLAFALKVADRIRLAISESPLRISSDLVNLTVSLGVATLSEKVSTMDEVLSLVRSALKRSKNAGTNRVAVARESAMELENEEGKDIVELLTDGSHFRTVFQPVIDLSTERVAGYEIFTRGPDGAFESPVQFFRVCIENNILTSVDISCLKQCIAATEGVNQNIRFHINVFPSTLLDTQTQQLVSLFPREKDGRVFCVEISEQHFIGDPGSLREHVQALRQAGILVAIDDVGFGRSSLESLILLEPDLVKVDRKYVTGVSKEPGKARLLRRLANVAKSLGAEIVAEGIETKDDIPVLKEIGVHYGQGYLWGDLMEVLPGDTKAAWGKTYG